MDGDAEGHHGKREGDNLGGLCVEPVIEGIAKVVKAADAADAEPAHQRSLGEAGAGFCEKQ